MSEGEFLRRQVHTVREYIARFPKQEKEIRALEWIEKNAERYRWNWQRDVIAAKLFDIRCPDCPLERDNESFHCEIHDGWLDTLNGYMEGKISSARYVEDSLFLLEAHKTRLKVARLGAKPP